MEKNGELQIYSIISGLQCFAESNNTASKFINDPEVKQLMSELHEFYSTKEFYIRFIKILIDNYVSNPGMQNNLYNALEKATDLRIFNYRQYLLFKGHCMYDKKKEKRALVDNSNLSTDLFEDLFNYGIEYVNKKYDKTLDEISKINKIDIKKLINLFNNLIVARINNDGVEYTNITVKIKNYIKKYNSVSKENFAKAYSDNRISEIKKYFVKKQAKVIDDELNESIVRDYIKRNESTLTNIIEKYYGEYIDDELLYIFVKNLLDKNASNLDKLGIVKPQIWDEVEIYDEYLRLVHNYQRNINIYFTADDLYLINEFFAGNKSIYSKLTKIQKKFLNDLKPVVIAAHAEVYVGEDGFITFRTDAQEPTAYERHLVEEYTDKVNWYNTINSDFHKFKNEKTGLDAHEQQITNLFNDANFELNGNYDYLNNLDFVARIIDKIDNDEFITSNYDEFSDFLSDIIPCLLVSGDNQDLEFISNFFNYITRVPKNTEFKIHELSTAYKIISLYKYIDEETIDVLGDEVCRKLVFNNQFIDSKFNDEDIRKRLEKAVFSMSKAHDITHSSIPYFEDIKHNNITLRRYNNADSRVLTSGIDTNTCFKLDANDNDFILYSILSSNGLLIEILNDGVLCGRITATLFYNVLVLNGIRNVKNEYISSNLEEKEINKNIVEAVEILADKLIELTKSGNCPIDHVCCNMAGILESNEFWQNKPIVTVLNTPIDTFSEDFEHFKSLFKEHPEYLSQIKLNSNESYYMSAPFTTDFGSYPLVLIKSREGKNLSRKFDIALEAQKPIYERPSYVEIAGTGYLSQEEIRLCKRINALHVYKNDHIARDDTKIYMELSKKFKSYYITDTQVVLESSSSNPIIYRI